MITVPALSKTAAMDRLGATFSNVRWGWDATRRDGTVIFIAWEDEVVLRPDGALLECRLVKSLAVQAKELGAHERVRHLHDLLASGAAGYVVLATAKDPKATPRAIARMDERLYTVRIEQRDGAVYAVAVGVDSDPAASAQDERAVDNGAEAAPLDSPETEREQAGRARRGQGLFRARVDLLEPACRVTGVRDRAHLRASHIKPWRVATNTERLDGNNGLLLAPHIDHLFDRGYLSFADDGALLVSPLLSAEVVRAWGIDSALRRPIRDKQLPYLAYHRSHVFRNAPAEMDPDE